MDMLRPDMKSVIWLAIGFFIAPKILKMVGK